jgi:hypothetical protein
VALSVVLAAVTGDVDILYGFAAASCPAAIAVGVRLHRPEQTLPWAVLGAGSAAFVAGDVLWTIEFLNGDGFPAGSDVLYLIGYPAIGAGIVLFAQHRRSPLGPMLDTAIVGGGAAALVALGVIRPLLAVEDVDALVAGVALTYPVASVILFTVSVAIALTGRLSRSSALFLCGGLLCLLVADGLYAVEVVAHAYAPEMVTNTLWMLFYGGLGALALHPSMRDLDRPQHRDLTPLTTGRLALLMAAALAVPVTDLVFGLGPRWAMSVVSAAMILLVALRVGGLVAVIASAATRDALTGLPNRKALHHELDHALAGHRSHDDGRLVVLFCDLDHFKVVNDGLGHRAGTSCSSPSPPASARPCATATPSPASEATRRCARRSPATSCSPSTSRRSSSAAASCSAWRRWCAGATRCGGW